MGKSNRGAALLLVLWGLVIVSGITLATLARTKADLSLVSARETLVRLNLAGEAGIAIGAARIASGDTAGTTSTVLGDAKIDVTITPEAGRLDVNFAAPELLRGLFRQQLGADGVRLANELIRKRDAVEGVAFSHPSSLMQHGLSSSEFDVLSPYLTTHTRQRGFDPLSASRPVLLSVPRVDAPAVDAFIVWRADQSGPPPALSFFRPYLQPPVPTYRVSVEADLFDRSNVMSGVLSSSSSGAISRVVTYRE